MRTVIFIPFLVILFGCQASSLSTAKPLNGEVKMFKELEREKANRDRNELLLFMSLSDMFPDERVRALARAAGRGQTDKIDKLVKSGVDVNSRGTLGATPLFWAFKNVKGFQRLLELGADPNAFYEDGGSVVSWAIQKENTDFLRLAIKYGADVDLVNPLPRSGHETPLTEALILNFDESVEILLDAGADVSLAIETTGQTPFALAASQGKFKFLLTMLEKGADYTSRDHLGWPFRYSVSWGLYWLEVERGRNKSFVAKHEPYLSKVKDWLYKRGVVVPSVTETMQIAQELKRLPYNPPPGQHPRLMKLGVER